MASLMRFCCADRSMVELANETIEDNKIEELMTSLFRDSKLANSNQITFNDFNAFLQDYQSELSLSSLNFECEPYNIQNSVVNELNPRIQESKYTG